MVFWKKTLLTPRLSGMVFWKKWFSGRKLY
jgi:hypothetical protein